MVTKKTVLMVVLVGAFVGLIVGLPTQALASDDTMGIDYIEGGLGTRAQAITAPESPVGLIKEAELDKMPWGVDASGENRYKPDEVIVKFKKPASDILEMQLAKNVEPKNLKLSASLDTLNLKHKVRAIEPVFKNFKARRERISNLLKKDSKMLKSDEKRLLKRLQRAPKGFRAPDLDRIYTVKLEAGQSAEQAAADYSKNPAVEYAELNYVVSICSTEPNDTAYPVQWSLANTGQMYPSDGRFKIPPGRPDCDIDANEAWDIHIGSPDVIVAVVDTGVDYTHRDLINNMWTDSSGSHGYDYFFHDNDPMDDHGHGTHCSGTIAAGSNNGLDVAGISWNSRIMALKFLGPNGSGYSSDAVLAFYYATDNGADVISNSWGGGSYNQVLQDAIDYAYSEGIIIVAAAGNNGSSSPVNPANYNHVLAVAATDSNDDKASFSNYGDWVDLAAPGVDILSLRAGNTDMYGDGNHFYPVGDPNATMYISCGTSMACPHVAGACALLLSVNPFINHDDANRILTGVNSVDLIADGICRSDGRLNVYKAMIAAVPSKGYVGLDKNYYNCNCGIDIFLTDLDLAGDGSNSNDVNIASSGGDWVAITLTETGSNTGIFTGQISTASGDPNIGDGILQVAHGETITVTYKDANDGSGNSSSTSDTADVDCISPNIISDVNITVLGPDVIVTFQTDEYSVGRVMYGLDCNDLDKSNINLGTDHNIKLMPLSPWTDYYFAVKAVDMAGNEVIDDNDGNCYRFSTSGPGDCNVPGDFNTIQEAIDNSWDGGTVTVAEGTYHENVDFKGRAITVTSTNPYDRDVVENTVIADANWVWSTITFNNREGVDTILTGFTVKYSGKYSPVRGGIRIDNTSSPTIRRCVIESKGCGILMINIYGHGCSPVITDNDIKNGTIGMSNVGLTKKTGGRIENNRIHGNSNAGMVIAIGYADGAKINNNLIYNNKKGITFGVGTAGGKIANNTIVGNNIGVSVYKGEVMSSEGLAHNCILWGNVDDLVDCNATYCCIEDVNDANGGSNSSVDPCFVKIFDFPDVTDANGTTTTMIVKDANLYDINDVIEYDDDGIARIVTDVNITDRTITFADALDANSLIGTMIYNWGHNAYGLNEDYHLSGSGSPCYNAGDPNGDYSGQSDIDGAPRVMDGRVDIGADEVGCLSYDAVEHSDWAAWDAPDCWCYKRQCRGDADSKKAGPFWVGLFDLTLFRNAFNKTDTELQGVVENGVPGICADFDHTKIGGFRVQDADLNIIRLYLNKLEPYVPCCDADEDCVLDPNDRYNFWTN